MKGKIRWFLAPLVIVALLLGGIPAQASIPTMPHPFYGAITIGGSVAPVGTEITAKVAGVECGSYTTTVEGQYGSSDPYQDDSLIVQGDIETGAEIYFYVTNTELSLDEVQVDQPPYPFESGADLTELNLTVGEAETIVTINAVTTPTNVVTQSLTGARSAGLTVVLTSAEATFEAVTYPTDTTWSCYVNLVEGSNGITATADTSTDTATIVLDTTPPTVLSTIPEADVTDEPIDAVVSATFSEDIEEGTNFGDIAISPAAGASASIDGATLTIAHDALELDTIYTVTIPAGAVNDLAENPLAEAEVWSFTTVFVPITYTLTVDSTAGGEVTLPGEDTFGPYDPEEEVPLLAEPADGYQFLSWTGDVDTVAEPTAESTTITMNGNYSITANFGEIGVTYTLTISSTTGGSVTEPVDAISTHNSGTVVTLLAVADTGYQFANWTGDTADIANVNGASTTITMNGDYTITANFAEVTGDLGELIAGVEPGGTLSLPAGTYTGDVTIDEPITITGIEGETTISGGITILELTDSNVIIENLIITDYTEFGIRIVKVKDVDNFIIRNNTIEGAEGNVIGIQVDAVEDGGILTIECNSISGNEIGIKLLAPVAEGQIWFNDIDGNEVGLELLAVGEHQVAAHLNWWGDISGPEEENQNPGGIGDKILVDGLDYYPWLTREFRTVLDDNIAYFGFPMVELNKGWNIISTPIALDPDVEWVDSAGTSRTGVNTWGNYVALGDGLSTDNTSPAYSFDAETQAWVALSSDDTLDPCDAIYVRMASEDRAATLYSPNVSVPSKELYAGWNLVGLAWLPTEMGAIPGLPADEALVTVEEVTGRLPGYKLVVSLGMSSNEQAWIHIAGQTILPWTDPQLPRPDGWMVPTSGYWVFMLNDGTLAGFTFTPVSLD